MQALQDVNLMVAEPSRVGLDEDSFPSESGCSGWTTGINECGEFQGYTTAACLESEKDSG